MTYDAHGVLLDSELFLPEQSPSEELGADCVLRLFPPSIQARPSHPWQLERPTAAGGVRFCTVKDAEDYLIRFPDLADFHIRSGGREIRCVPTPDTPDELLGHLLLNHVLPLSLTTLGRLVLNASAVEIAERAIVFVGPSGAGKSTVADALYQQGGTLLADGYLVVDNNDGTPQAPKGSATDRGWSPRDTVARRKTPTPGGWSRTGGPVSIERIYVLEPLESTTDGGVTVTPALKRAACMELIKSVVQLDGADPAATCRSVNHVEWLASSCAVSRLQFAKDTRQLPSMIDAVASDCRTSERVQPSATQAVAARASDMESQTTA